MVTCFFCEIWTEFIQLCCYHHHHHHLYNFLYCLFIFLHLLPLYWQFFPLHTHQCTLVDKCCNGNTIKKTVLAFLFCCFCLFTTDTGQIYCVVPLSSKSDFNLIHHSYSLPHPLCLRCWSGTASRFLCPALLWRRTWLRPWRRRSWQRHRSGTGHGRYGQTPQRASSPHSCTPAPGKDDRRTEVRNSVHEKYVWCKRQGQARDLLTGIPSCSTSRSINFIS